MRSLPLPLIRRLVPLSGLNEHSLQLLLEKSDWPLIASGQRLFSNEQYGRCYIYLLSGEAELIYSSGSAVHTAEQPFPIGYAIELDLSYQGEHDDEASWRLTLLKSNLFVKVPPLNVGQIYSRLKPMQVKAGDVILQQGDPGDGCYFIRRGKASVTRRNPGETIDHHIVDIGYGRCFGEDALVYDTVRNASVTMATDGLLMRLNQWLSILKQ